MSETVLLTITKDEMPTIRSYLWRIVYCRHRKYRRQTRSCRLEHGSCRRKPPLRSRPLRRSWNQEPGPQSLVWMINVCGARLLFVRPAPPQDGQRTEPTAGAALPDTPKPARRIDANRFGGG